MNGKFRFVAGCFLASMVAVGCERKPAAPANLPPLLPFKVIVQQESRPVDGAFVRLLPPDEKMPWSCGATTDASGVAVIKTLGQFDGAPKGSYKVLISKLETPKMADTDLSNLDAKVDPKASQSVNVIDLKYSAPESTPLEITVADGTSEATFDVGAPVRSAVKAPKQ